MLLCAALPLLAERQPLDRYQSIIDRQMFGAPPPGFDPTKPASEVSKSAAAEESAQQAQIKSAIRFSAINVTPDGQTAVGFTDSSDSKNPVHYYLKVGESSNGWLVKEADPVKATMTIAKDDVEVMLSIGGDSSKSGTEEPSTGRPGTRRLLRTASTKSGLTSLRSTSSTPTSLRERRKMREQMRQAQAAEAAEEKAAEAARREEERRRAEEEKAQREAEREEQRAQLQQIQEELRKVRAAKEKEAQRAEAANVGENGNADEE